MLHDVLTEAVFFGYINTLKQFMKEVNKSNISARKVLNFVAAAARPQVCECVPYCIVTSIRGSYAFEHSKVTVEHISTCLNLNQFSSSIKCY